MTPLWHLTYKSILNRGLSVLLTVLTVALSVAMLLGIERFRHDVHTGFSQTVSGVDLIVGARSGPLQLLLYSVFHIGNATNNISWQSVQNIARNEQVDWVVPISLGDSHRGFRVVGTTEDFFQHFHYGRNKALQFATGRGFQELFDVVIGAEVAARFDYRLGQSLILSHSTGELSGAEHDDRPFEVAGILARTGTPVDRSLLVSLEAIEAIHVDWAGGVRLPGVVIPSGQLPRFDLTPKTLTAALVGLKSRVAVFKVQRQINQFTGEPLLAILPGVTLQELWGVMGFVEKTLLLIAALVVIVSLAGLVAVVISSLNERRRELAILRAMGAGAGTIFLLLLLESVLIGVLGCLVGVVLVQGLALLFGPWLQAHYGLLLHPGWLTATEWGLLGAVLLAVLAASLVVGLRAYCYSVADGMTVRM